MKQYLTIFLSLLLFACQEDSHYINLKDYIKDSSSSVKYAIEAQITTFFKRQHVIITKPSGTNYTDTFEGVSNAKVVIKDNKGKVFNFTQVPKTDPLYKNISYKEQIKNGIYQSDTFFKADFNTTYTLEITIANKTYSATETTPVYQDITAREFTVLKNTELEYSDDNFVFSESHNAIFNAYAAPKHDLHIVLNKGLGFFERPSPEKIVVTDDIAFSASILETGILSKYVISDAYADYRWAFLNETVFQGSVFSVEPGKIPSNFNSPEIAGFFSVLAAKEYQVSDTQYILREKSMFLKTQNYNATFADYGEIQWSFFPETATFTLKSKTQELTGDYAIINGNTIEVFIDEIQKEYAEQLYHFYETVLKQTQTFYYVDNYVYRYSLPKATLTLKENTLVSMDNTIWNSL